MYYKSPIDKILLVGNGGHCGVITDALYRFNPHIKIGLVTKEPDSSPLFVGVDADLPRLLSEGWTQAFVAVGSVGDCSLRAKIARSLEELGFECPAIVDPTAIVSPSAVIGRGAFVGAGAVINAHAGIGDHAIINTHATVEHDCSVGHFSHISPGTVLCGAVKVGNGAHVGAACCVRQGVSIGNNTLVGMGSVVTKDLPDGCVAFGNPCKIQK